MGRKPIEWLWYHRLSLIWSESGLRHILLRSTSVSIWVKVTTIILLARRSSERTYIVLSEESKRTLRYLMRTLSCDRNDHLSVLKGLWKRWITKCWNAGLCWTSAPTDSRQIMSCRLNSSQAKHSKSPRIVDSFIVMSETREKGGRVFTRELNSIGKSQPIITHYSFLPFILVCALFVANSKRNKN